MTAEAEAKAATKFTDEDIKAYLEGKITAKEATHMSDGIYEGLYASAFSLFEAGHYVEALSQFLTLGTINAKDKRPFQGAANCLLSMEQYGLAAFYFLLAYSADTDDPTPFLTAATCYMSMGDRESARHALNVFLRQAKDREDLSEAKLKAEVMLENLDEE